MGTHHSALVAALIACLAGCGGGDAPQRPDILLITLDTTRPDYFSTYGFEGGETPNFDALAAEGARFDMGISASGVTPVSHASILTGKYPYRHGLRVLRAAANFTLGPDEETIATLLQPEGYRTGAALSAFTVSSLFGFDRGFESFDSQEGEMLAAKKNNRPPWWDMQTLQRRCDETTASALAFATASEEPFFLWVHYWDPHDRLMVPPDEFLEGLEGERKTFDREELYAREIEYVDHEFGKLLDGLRAAGRYENLVIAVAGDHGEGLADGMERHGWSKHRMVYQEQIHVPFILRVPGGAPGQVFGQVVRTVDLVPTLLDYSGTETQLLDFDGRSLRELLEGREAAPRIAYSDQINGYDLNAGIAQRRPDSAFLFSVIDLPWKLIYRPHMQERTELFNLEQDPGELVNLVADHPEIVHRLLQDLARRNPWVTAPPAGAGDVDTSLLGDALEGLGYTGGDEEEVDLVWTWTCWQHPEIQEQARARCPSCEGLLVPRAKW